jgi:hypothetical protein
MKSSRAYPALAGRNIYTFNLKPARLTELAANVEYCLRLVQEDLNGFIDFLNTVAAE